MSRPATNWSGCCSWCGACGDASTLFCYSACTEEFATIWAAANPPEGSGVRPYKMESRFQFCDAAKTDCLERWLSHRKPAHVSDVVGGSA
jgi:hypothetical protein